MCVAVPPGETPPKIQERFSAPPKAAQQRHHNSRESGIVVQLAKRQTLRSSLTIRTIKKTTKNSNKKHVDMVDLFPRPSPSWSATRRDQRVYRRSQSHSNPYQMSMRKGMKGEERKEIEPKEHETLTGKINE
eukprot:gene2048-1236_t